MLLHRGVETRMLLGHVRGTPYPTKNHPAQEPLGLMWRDIGWRAAGAVGPVLAGAEAQRLQGGPGACPV